MRERLTALAAFAAIALGGAVALDVLVTGGFDFAPPSSSPLAADPAASTSLSGSSWPRVAPATFASEPPLMEAGAASEQLLGGEDAEIGDGAARDDELRREIEALYAAEGAEGADLAAQPLEDVPDEDEPLSEDEAPVEDESKPAPEASASDSEPPW